MPSRPQPRLAGAGFALLLAAAVALTILVAMVKAPLPGDLTAARAIQAAPAFLPLARAVNHLGDPPAQALIAAAALVLYARKRWHARWRLAATVAAGSLLRGLGGLLKLLAESPRPSAEGGVAIHGDFGGYGFPSGHVYGDVLVFGLLALVAPAWLPPRLVLPARLVALAVAFLSGPARVAVGAHWPSDTVGGYLWGGAALLGAALLLRAKALQRLDYRKTPAGRFSSS